MSSIHQRDLELTGVAQQVHHLYQRVVGHRPVGALEHALLVIVR
jgi:hypothetical protein